MELEHQHACAPEGCSEHDLHVVPQFGREHESYPSCWCHPKRDRQAALGPDSRNIWVHEPGYPS